MSLTRTTAWRQAVERDGARLRMLVSIYDGTNTWKAVSGSMDSTSDLAKTAVAVAKVAPLGVELDPFTREIKAAQVYVDFADVWLRPKVVNYVLKGQRVNIYLGAAELDEADFLSFAENTMIEKIIPEGQHTIRLQLIGQLKMVMDAKIHYSYWLNTHPLECLYDGAGGGVLEVAGAHSFNVNSFDRTQAEYDDIDHVIAGRAFVIDYNEVTESRARYEASGTHHSDAYTLAHGVIQLINGYLLEDEEGDLRVARFDASASAVDNWGVNDIIPDSFTQESLDDNVINQICFNFSPSNADPSKLIERYIVNDTVSQSTFAFPGGNPRIFSKEFNTYWVGTRQTLYANISDVAPSLQLSGPACYAVSGNRSDMTVDADHPVYLLLDSSQYPGVNNLEIVKSTSLTRSSTFTGDVTVNVGGGTWTQEGPYSSLLTFANLSRSQRGTSASNHYRIGTIVYDITALVNLGDSLLARFSNGCPIIELSTPINKFFVQIGDLVTVTWPYYVAYGKNGMTSAVKWEVVTKEVDVFANPPSIRWRLAYAVEGSPTLSAASLHRTNLTDDFDRIGAEKLATQFAVSTGLGITQKAGLVGTIAAGNISNGVRSIYLMMDLDHTYTASKDTYTYLPVSTNAFAMPLYKEVANGAADPGTEDDEVLLGKVVTDGAGITSVVTTNVETLTIPGSNLKAGTGPLAKLSQSGFLDNLTSITTRSLDDVSDGATYAKVKSTGLTAGVVNTTGLVAEAVTAAKVADAAIAPAHFQTATLGQFLNANARMSKRTRG